MIGAQAPHCLLDLLGRLPCPVAFNSMQLKGAEKNYPVHDKELLAIIHTFNHWRSYLLRTKFVIYTDHCTLENFDTQYDLSRQQLCWQEFLSQYDFCITYIHGEDNTVVDALSHVLFWTNLTMMMPHVKYGTPVLMLSFPSLQTPLFCNRSNLVTTPTLFVQRSPILAHK